MMESYPAGVANWGQARACRTGEPVELTVIIAGLLLTVGGLGVLGGLVLRVGDGSLRRVHSCCRSSWDWPLSGCASILW